MLTFEFMEESGDMDKKTKQELRTRLTVKAGKKMRNANIDAARELLVKMFPGLNLFIMQEWFEHDEPPTTYPMYAIFWLDKRFRISPWYYSALHLPSWAEPNRHMITAYVYMTRHLLAMRPESEKLLRKAPS